MVDWPGPTPRWHFWLEEVIKFEVPKAWGSDWLWVKLGPRCGLKSCTRTSKGWGRQLQLSQELLRKGGRWHGENKAGLEKGQSQRTGLPGSPKASAVARVDERFFSWRSWIQNLFLGLSFLSGKVLMVSTDFGKYT